MTLQEFESDWQSASPRLLVHTSGSTGTPKPLWVEKERMRASARMTCSFLGLREGDSALLCLPLDYIAGKMMAVRAWEWGLHLVSVPPSNRPLLTLTTGEPHLADSPSEGWRGLFIAMVPSQVYTTLTQGTEEERHLLRSARHLIIGGGAISPDLARLVRNFPNAVWSTYGMTETLSHVALRRLNGPEASDWYTPLPGVTLTLSPEDNCLVIDCPRVCPEPLKTNDIAELREDPHGGSVSFRILGRKDNVICSGGLKLQIEQMEEELLRHIHAPFCITKRPDPRFGEAAVLLTTTPVNLKELLARVSPSSHLRYIKDALTIPHIPLTATGKTDRAKARNYALNGGL